MSPFSLPHVAMFASVALGFKLAPTGISISSSSVTPHLAARASHSGTTGDPTQFYSVQTTGVPEDDYLIGLGTFTDSVGDESTFYWECMNSQFTVINGYAGCGRDDVYTSCSSNIAFGVDGDMIACTRDDSVCATHSIYQDLDATTHTPFIFCATATTGWALARAWTSSDTSAPPSMTNGGQGATSSVAGNVEPTNTEPSGGQKMVLCLNLYIVVTLLCVCLLAI